MNINFNAFQISNEISRGLRAGKPIVALESTVLTHGLPHPENLSLAKNMETQVRGAGSIPATIAILNGKILVGMESDELESLVNSENLHKVSSRDIAAAVTQKASGGTTVAGTLVIAEQVGITVFATGGIGGVHHQPSFDISADLLQLSKSKVVVVCAGAKAILNLPATLEYLETVGVPVIGYKTDEFPAFYSRKSGLPVSQRADSAEEISQIAKNHWALGLGGSILVVAPPPKNVEIPAKEISGFLDQALEEADAKQVRGQQLTPFLLGRVNELTGGDSVKANLGLLKNNSEIAGELATYLALPKSKLGLI